LVCFPYQAVIFQVILQRHYNKAGGGGALISLNPTSAPFFLDPVVSGLCARAGGGDGRPGSQTGGIGPAPGSNSFVTMFLKRIIPGWSGLARA
jgi:hypothetical protein